MHIHQENHWNRVLFYWYQLHHWYQWRPFLSPLTPMESICEYWTTLDLGGITFRKKGNGLCFRRMLWISSVYTFTSSLFYIVILRIYAELIVIIGFDRAENRSALVWETVVRSLSKKRRLFYSHNFRKKYTADCSFIASFLWFFQNVWVVSGRR